MRVLTCAPSDDLRRLRRTVAAAIERLRALDLSTGDAATAREVACIALGALSTALFVGGDSAGPRVPAALIESEIRQVADLLGFGTESRAANLPTHQCPSERTTVSP